MNKTWKYLCVGMLVASQFGTAIAASPLAANGASPRRGNASGSNRGAGFGFAAVLDRSVGFTPEQRDAVRGLLADQRQKTQAMREQTDSKIRSLLNADQQKKFDAFLADQKARRSK